MALRIHLRAAIGVINALCVLVVGAIALAVTATVSLDTLRSNGDRHVLALGNAAVDNVEDIFSDVERLNNGVRDVFRAGEFMLPADDPTRRWSQAELDAAGIPAGGRTLDRLRSAWWSYSAALNFTLLASAFWLVDGTRVAALPILTLRSTILIEMMFQTATTNPIPFAPPQINRTFTALDIPTGTLMQPDATPELAAYFAQRSKTTSIIDSRHPAVMKVFHDYAGPNRADRMPTTWTPVRFFHDQGDYHYNFALTSLYNASGTFMGYCISLVGLDVLQARLDKLRPTGDTVMAVVDGEGYLLSATTGVAVSNQTALNATAPIPPGCTTTAQSTTISSTKALLVCRHHTADSGNAVLRHLSASGHVTSSSYQGKVSTSDGAFYVRVGSLPEVTLSATVVVIVPEKEILGDVQRTFLIAAGATAAAIVVAAVVVFFFVWAVLRPLISIADSMGKAARLEDDTTAVSESRFVEIGDLQRAFVEMRDELGRIRCFVPQSLLKASDGTSGEEDDDDDETCNIAGKTQESSGRHTPHAHMVSVSSVRSESSDDRTFSRSHSRTISHTGSPRDAASPAHSIGANNLPSNFPSSHVSGRYRHNHPHKSVGRKLDAVRRENVTVLALNLTGYHRHVAASSSDGLCNAEHLAAVLTVVAHAVDSEKGVVDSFHGDRVMVSFNAVRHAAGHGIRAARVSARVAKQLVSTPLGSLRLTSGVATGPATVGNMGTATMKRFGIVGPVVSQAACLERLCKLYSKAGPVSCLVPQRLFEDLATAVSVQAVDFVQLPFVKAPCLVGAVLREFEAAAEDEWMYQLQGQSAPHHDKDAERTGAALLHRGWLAAARGDFTAAGVDLTALDATAADDGFRAGHAQRLRSVVAAGALSPNPLGDFYDSVVAAPP